MARERRLGVTFLELMIVITVLSVLMLLTIPAMRGPHEKNKLRADARKLVSIMRYARSAAVLNETDVTLEIDVKRGQYWLDLGRAATKEAKSKRETQELDVEQAQLLEKDIYFAAVFSWDDPEKSRGLARIKFYADGSASDSTVVLENRFRKHMTVAVNRATGESEVFWGVPADWKESAEKG